MDSNPATSKEESLVKAESTVPQHVDNPAKKKKKKKKKSKSAEQPEFSNHLVGAEGESANNSTLTEECAVKQQTNLGNGTKNVLEEKAKLNNPLSECANRSGDEAKRDDCGVKPVLGDVAEQDDKKASSASETAAQKKKKKKTKKSTFEEKKEANTPCDVSVDNNDSESKTMEQGECTKTPLAVVDVHLQDHSPETGRKKKKKKTKKSAFEEKEEAISPCGVNVDNNDSESKTKHGIDEEMLADVNVVKDQSSSPKTGRNKKKKKKGGGFLLSQVSLSEPQNDSEKERNGSGVDEKEAKKTLCNEQITRTKEASDLKKFTGETSLLRVETKERNNLSKVLIITNGLGLDTLRKLFKDIHPSWSNKPDDAKTLDKGRMKLQKHELALFNTGDINKWDVSLMTTVLLFSKECAKELSNRGYEDAVRTIKDQKNQLISHVSSDRMTGDEFNTTWAKISKSLKTIGASTKDIEDIHTDDILQGAKFYRDMLLQELAAKDAVQPQIQNIDSTVQDIDVKMDKVINLLSSETSATCENQPGLQDFGPKFNEWRRFCENVNHFDHHKNNYILITDAMSPENLEHFSVLRSVPWKIVLDFDPSSEEHGMYNDFVTKDGKNSLIDMTTPEELRRQHTVTLSRDIDQRKTHWLFVKGREKDNLESGGVQSLRDWKSSSLKHISRFLSCSTDPEKLDKHKPVICVILPFIKETLPFLEVTLERLFENFDEFRLHLVGVKHENIHNLQSRFNGFDIRLADLSPSLLSLGLKDLLQVSSGKEYRLPMFQAGLSAKLTPHRYLFLQEYLDVLYDGCEDLPKVDDLDDEEKLNTILKEHRESFLSGNWISFVSLYDNHDARREVGEKVRNYTQRLLEQRPNNSTILEIRHSPGTGGTTIGRRVLWDLHNSYPCAIARLEDYKYDSDDRDDFHFINALADRINDMQDICQMNPLILLDGNHSRIEALSNKLGRVLNSRGQRAVLLSCIHRSAKTSDAETSPEITDVHDRFIVNVELEESLADVRQFEDKYKDYIDEFKKAKAFSACRVFHFPLLAMLKGLQGFGSKLEQIIHESFDEMDGLRKKIAVVVAFIQQYAAQETPASLLYKAFKKHVRKSDIEQEGITYKEINQLITDQLLSLMVPARPTRYPRRASTSSDIETYSLQHPLVADMVLQRYYKTQKCDIFTLTREFLEFPIFQDYRFFSLLNSLFIRNRSSLPNAKFSILFDELRSSKPRVAAELFRELAEKTSDAIMFAHAARFHARSNPPSFQAATELIAQAFKCKNATPKSRIIYDMKGQILQSQLKLMVEKQEINSISKLEEVADEALQSYKRSRSWPLTYPLPLMGEVKVWISCIEWITKNECNGDTDKAFEFITSTAPPFFHTCIGDSLHLLDIVDTIVQSEPNLTDPDEIQKQANNLRMSLLRTFNKDKRRRREKDHDIIRACKALCSPDKFPKCSPAELKRLQVHYMLSSVDQIEAMKNENIEFLLKLLEDLVLTDKQSGRVRMASHLMKVSLFITGPKQYSLDKGLRVAEIWKQESGYDPLPYFYQMMIAFMMILDGNQVFYRDRYHEGLDKCREKSVNHLRRLMSTHFLKKTGEGMNRLMTKSALLTGETEYLQNIDDFWTTQSRKKLLECSGRIKIRSKSAKRKQVYIELVQGNIELYVGKNADIGKIERDYSQGTMVYFVVSFSLEGPVANGITLKPRDNPPKSSSTK